MSPQVAITSININFTVHLLEEHLQFVFKYIDPKDEDKPFVFTVAITNQDKYNGNAVTYD